MPYIPREVRHELFDNASERRPRTAGELNFIISDWINDYLLTNGLNYRNINDCIGALECAKMELYRRIAAPYEDIKLRENGDVYGSENQV